MPVQGYNPNERVVQKLNASLPGELRQSAVLLEFASPYVPAWGLGQFLTIRLHEFQQQAGEDAVYQPERVQPEKLGVQNCRTCRKPMDRIGLWDWICGNPDCVQTTGQHAGRPTATLVQTIAPLQGGVIKLVTSAADELREPGTAGRRLKRCLLLMDRRYPDSVLAAVYRTAGDVCDEFGWRLAR